MHMQARMTFIMAFVVMITSSIPVFTYHFLCLHIMMRIMRVVSRSGACQAVHARAGAFQTVIQIAALSAEI